MADVIRANYACACDPRAAWIPVDQPSCEVRGTAGDVNAELVRTISAEQLRDRIDKKRAPLVLDVREVSEFEGDLGRVPLARLIPLGELPRRLSELEALAPASIVTVCRSGGRSATAAAILSVAGFKEVRSLEGGMKRWNELGFPVERRSSA
jgi:rhodanese-related sulfurtransferase